MTWRFSAEYASGRSNETSPTVHAAPSPAATMVRTAVRIPIQTPDPPTPRRRSERRAIAYFQTSARMRATPATRCATYRIPAAVSGRSQARMPDASSVVIAASKARFARRRGTEAMLARGRWQTECVRERHLLVLSEDPLNAETRLDEKTPVITPAGRHYVRTHFPIPTGPRSIVIDGVSTTSAAISLEEIRALPARPMVVTLECAGNGRRFLDPKVPGEQWGLGAVGTATWTGARLRHVAPRAVLVYPPDGAVVERALSLIGFAWSGAAPVARVELSRNGDEDWVAMPTTFLERSESPYGWAKFTSHNLVLPGLGEEYSLLIRAVDAAGNAQPLSPRWNALGYANNAVRPTRIRVRS